MPYSTVNGCTVGYAESRVEGPPPYALITPPPHSRFLLDEGAGVLLQLSPPVPASGVTAPPYAATAGTPPPATSPPAAAPPPGPGPAPGGGSNAAAAGAGGDAGAAPGAPPPVANSALLTPGRQFASCFSDATAGSGRRQSLMVLAGPTAASGGLPSAVLQRVDVCERLAGVAGTDWTRVVPRRPGPWDAWEGGRGDPVVDCTVGCAALDVGGGGAGRSTRGQPRVQHHCRRCGRLGRGH